MTKISRQRRSRRPRIIRSSVTSQKFESIQSATAETEGRIINARDEYLSTIAEGFHNTLQLYWHSLSDPPTPRGRDNTAPFKPGRATIKKMLADFPTPLSNRHSIARALFEISVQGPHDPNLMERITKLANSLYLSYAK